VDQLGDQHGFAHARAAEQPGAAAPLQRGQNVYRFDAGLKYSGLTERG
jgi:hypothetical protein